MQQEPNYTVAGQRIWRKYEDGYIVRSMSQEDAVIVQDWYNENMGQLSRYDLDITLSCYPPNSPGFYIGEYEGEVVSAAVRLPWGENIMYGSYYYVAKPYRKKGFGTRLRDEVAREYVGERVLCVDACTGKVSADNVSRFDYSMSHESFRYVGVARDNYDDVISTSTNGKGFKIVKATEVEFENLINFDNECFISRDFPIRREFIRKWISIPDGATYVAINSSGHVIGYGSRHPSINEGEQHIGPLYATSPEVAESILARLASEVKGQNIYLNTSSRNKGAMEMVLKFGMKELFSLNRMYLNGEPKEHENSVFAFTSIDVCGF